MNHGAIFKKPGMPRSQSKSTHVILVLDFYETGWDKAWSGSDGNYTIEAHAPSKIVLTALNPGPVSVCPVVRQGGQRRGVPLVNGSPVTLDVWEVVDVEKYGTIELKVRLDGDRDGCWNQWFIKGVELRLSEEVRISFWNNAHLGDSLGMLIGCENYGRVNQRKIVVRETPLFRDISGLFDFSWVTLEGGDNVSDHHRVHIHPFGYNFEELGWVKGICTALVQNLGGLLPDEILYPNHRIHPLPEVEAITLVQFDGRSSGQWQQSTLQRILRLYGGKRIAVLGGPDTKSYLGGDLEYRTGNLDFIARQLLACERFVGVDSGIAHLACVLGLEIDLLPAPEVSSRLVQGIFGYYPKAPHYRSLSETRCGPQCDRNLYLISTTNGWNLGDDLIRQGVLRLLEIDETRESVVWLNRCQVEAEDNDRHCSWSPLWKRLRNLGDTQSLAENARALIVAGTPEWIDTMQPFFRHAVTTSLPIWIVGVGGDQGGQCHHLKSPVKSGCLRVATVRDAAAKAALAGQGIDAPRFLDPAFHSTNFTGGEKGEFLFNPRLETKEQERLYFELYKKLRHQIDIVLVHEPMEHARATNLFDRPVFYHSDYRRYIDLYRRCSTYVGGRMHGAIPSLASGAEVHLICHEGKHLEMEWTRGHLDHPEALSLSSVETALDIEPTRCERVFDQAKCLQADFEAHRDYLKSATSPR